MVMPGRITTLSGGAASPGPQVASNQGRPIPAVRRSTHNVADSTAVAREDDKESSFQRQNLPTAASYDRGPPQPSIHGINMVSYRAQTNRPVSAVRPQSAMAVASPSNYNGSVSERPPSSLGVAWGPAPRYQPTNRNTPDGRKTPTNINNSAESLEARLKSLVATGDQSRQSPAARSQHMDNEIIFPVHHQTRSFGDGVTLGHGYHDNEYKDEKPEDVYAVVDKRQDSRQKNKLVYDSISRYVPPTSYGYHDGGASSQPVGRSGLPFPQHAHSVQRKDTGSDGLGAGGQENKAFESEDSNFLNKTAKPNEQTPNGYDLRSAWQRLYGNRPAATGSLRHPSGEDTISGQRRSSSSELQGILNQRQQQNALSAVTIHPHNISSSPPQYPAPRPPVTSSPVSGIKQEQNQHNITNSRPPLHPHTSQKATGSTELPHHLNPHQQPHFQHKQEHHRSSSYSSNPHMQQSIAGRESPPGQSSSNPDQVSGSNNSSQLSNFSATNQRLSTFKPEKKKTREHASIEPAIGPASKYPDTISSSTRPEHFGSALSFEGRQTRTPVQDRKTLPPSRRNPSSPFLKNDNNSPRRHRSGSISSETVEFTVHDASGRPSTRGKNPMALFLDSEDELGDEYQLRPLDSIFDYHDADSDNRSATPPLPSLSPMPEDSVPSTSANMSPRYTSGVLFGGGSEENAVEGASTKPKIPDLLRSSGKTQSMQKSAARPRNLMEKSQIGAQQRDDQKQKASNYHRKETLSSYARSRSLEDVRESGNESVISFDVENTMLTVEPSDQSEMGTLRSHKGSSVRAQLHRLEDMYSKVVKKLEEKEDSGHHQGVVGSRTRRRWSIGSSDTSSIRHHTHQGRHGHGRSSASSGSRMGSRDAKAIGKRFQRLESHVITLARSVAHLSSELRSQNTLTREIENVKREMKELKMQGENNPMAQGHFTGGNRLMPDFGRSRRWVPSLSNPRRVNKLTKFFGQDPLLALFLEGLGYEKYAKKFEEEHIGMIELPYMTEERLQNIGIPMGPRLRILQEAQNFKQGDFDIYFV